MTLGAIGAVAQEHHLTVLGALHPDPGPGVPEGCGTLVLLGPDEPGFWPHFETTPEMRDGAADPMDRWSRRVITTVADRLGAAPLFPFGGPPFLPFFSWAQATGRIWASPVNFLVHDRAGLFVSFRGALAVPYRLDLPDPPPAAPCRECAAQPCRTACPVDALTSEGYDVGACKAYLASDAGTGCRTRGCRVRRSCPVSAGFGRLDAQSAFHMRNFTGDSP